MKMSRRTAGDRALYFAAILYWILGRNEKARDYVEKMLKLSNSSSQVCIEMLSLELNNFGYVLHESLRYKAFKIQMSL